MTHKKEKVVIGISGGVDSAVSCYLLKNSYFSEDVEVEGVFMQNWDDILLGNKLKSSNCSQVRDWKDAKEISNFIGVEITKTTFIEEYWREVFSEFILDMKKGITPNPDIACNRNIKFSHFFKLAREKMRASYVATGHYARVLHDENKNRHYLAKCRDQQKDQTYFLCSIKKEVLPYLVFPLSNLEKSEVRQIAERVKIPNSKKKDSTGICFIGEDNFNSFIGSFLEEKPGSIVDVESMEEVGNHKGYYFFTIGQRKGLLISGKNLPYYVVSKSIEENKIYVSSSPQEKLLYSEWCEVKNMNWLISEDELKWYSEKDVTVKFRHRQKEVKANFSFLNEHENIKILLWEPVRAVTPGQFAVLYCGEICLGGGPVFSTERLNSKCGLNN